MKILSLSEAKMKLSSLIEEVKKRDEEILITKNGFPAAVLISPEEFEGWKETATIRSDSSLMEEIQKGLRALKEKKARCIPWKPSANRYPRSCQDPSINSGCQMRSRI